MTSPAPHHMFHHAPLSSYESLDKFNSATETLKITDDYHQQKHNLINTMNRVPSCEIINTGRKDPPLLKQRQQSMNNNHKSVLDDVNGSQSSSLKRRGINEATDDYQSVDNELAVNKQKQLSDWYYIKTSPKPKPSSPYERRKARIPAHPSFKTLPATELYNNRNSTDKLSSLNGEIPFLPIQKFRSNDYIEQNNQFDFLHEEKSPLQTHKCFNVKYSRNPAGREDTTKFGEMISSSFEHVNVTGLYDNRFSENDLIRTELRICAGKPNCTFIIL